MTLQTGYDSVAALQMGKLIKDDLDCRSKLMFLLSCFNFCNTKLKKFDFRYSILCTFHKILQIPSINYLMMFVSKSFIMNEQTWYLSKKNLEPQFLRQYNYTKKHAITHFVATTYTKLHKFHKITTLSIVF